MSKELGIVPKSVIAGSFLPQSAFSDSLWSSRAISSRRLVIRYLPFSSRGIQCCDFHDEWDCCISNFPRNGNHLFNFNHGIIFSKCISFIPLMRRNTAVPFVLINRTGIDLYLPSINTILSLIKRRLNRVLICPSFKPGTKIISQAIEGLTPATFLFPALFISMNLLTCFTIKDLLH
ncbi:predicted protein [Lodderomyces elongisporus NRRL YB-4239]|uniref:Uncharacterized protein n=1 Tax=Lodderomyces elongisporus (strain ATCC 11503 / CBS 2605 / JCM 1781 / NBRC 1676 / NRRL YB-4239) TaxID=379508 RepID=A5DVF7_LODEL|nr:predicted protein [Lodderomyces elongisporus NRRL YB-4239]